MRFFFALMWLLMGILLADPVLTIIQELIAASNEVSVITGWPGLVLNAAPFMYFFFVGFIVFMTLKGKSDSAEG